MSRRRELAKNVALLAGTTLFFLAIFEVGLRLGGFSFVLYPEEIEFGKPDPVLLENAFLEDDDLFWVTKDYPEKLERLAASSPDVVFMGDSCTQFGTYDDAFTELAAVRGNLHLSTGNVGVAGWTSYQGRRQLERDVLPLAPKIVTVYYGWNDHWIGFGIEDKTIAQIKRIFSSRLSDLRVVQLLTKGLVVWRTRQTAFPERVALEDFRVNLEAIVELARDGGIRPVLLTAPTSIREGAEPDYLADRWVRDLSDVVPLHRAYTDAVRDVARTENVPLCDLAHRFAALSPAELDAAFMADGIHLTPEGDRRIAEDLADCFERDGLWEAIDTSRERD